MQTDTEIYAFCQNISTLRAEKGLSQKEMAEKLGISVQSLRNLEQGKLPPRWGCAVFFRIYQVYGIKPKDLFEIKK